MQQTDLLVIGGSHAAAQVVFATRRAGFEGSIRLVSDESMLPYHRPPLSKDVLLGNKQIEQIGIRPESAYAKADINVTLNVRAQSIDRQARQVVLSDESVIGYKKLVLATGASVRELPIPGVELQGVHYLRDANDAKNIVKDLDGVNDACIIGGGYIGLEAAASLRKQGRNVTVLEAAERLLQRVTTSAMSDFFHRLHSEEGVHVRTSAVAQALEGQQRVSSVRCADDYVVNAQLVIIGIGVVPQTELAEQAGLSVDNGIKVDASMRTSDANIFAIGDCASAEHGLYQQHLRIESVQNANDQAKVVAAMLCGDAVEYSALPWFWSDQYDVKLQIAGLPLAYDQMIIRGDVFSERSFSLAYLKGTQLVAMECVNCPVDFVASKALIASSARLDAGLLADDSIPLKEALIA